MYFYIPAEFGGGMARLKFWFILLLAFCCACTTGAVPPLIDSGKTTAAPTSFQYQIGVLRQNPLIRISVDAEFTLNEKQIIQKAFSDWERASENELKFDPKWDQPKPGPYADYEEPYEGSGLFLWHLRKNEDHLSPFLLQKFKDNLGLMVYGKGEDSGNVIIFDSTQERHLYSVLTHELGHFLGLKHIEVRGAIMHPTDLENCLTYADVEQLCNLYGCQPKSQCTPEEEFRLLVNPFSSESSSASWPQQLFLLTLQPVSQPPSSEKLKP
jgi:hypothetical protein